jgi:Flp pilus assembly protein TadG
VDVRTKNQKGAALVEFAVILPLLMLIVMGIIEFSILLFDKAMLTNASREGARVGIVFVPNRVGSVSTIETRIDQAVQNYCATNLISFGNPASVVINKTWVDGNDAGTTTYETGDSLEVEVTYSFRFLVFSRLLSFFGGTLGNVFNLQAVTVMRLE